jgi:dienelactone hydrolase
MAWFPNHTQAQTRPTLDKVIAALKQQGVTTFGATGYCFGGRYAFDLAFDGVIKAAVVSHPSLLEKPADLEKYAKTNVPLLLNTAESDEQFPVEAADQADGILGNGKFAPGYVRAHYPGTSHGFAVSHLLGSSALIYDTDGSAALPAGPWRPLGPRGEGCEGGILQGRRRVVHQVPVRGVRMTEKLRT